MTKGVFFTISESAYADAEFVSVWHDVSSFTNVEFIVLCDQDVTQIIEQAFDLNYNVINTISEVITAGNTSILTTDVNTKYIRFKLQTAVQPADLQCQAFYYN